MGVDRYRVCELYVRGPGVEGSGSGYRLGDRLVLTARHVIASALAGAGGELLVRPVGVTEWVPARVAWEDAAVDAALVAVEDEGWRAPAGESVLRWGELTGSDPVPCAAVGFPWASTRPNRMRDTAHLYGHLAPLGQLRQGRLDLDVASPSPSGRAGGSPWAGMSGAGVIADNHLVGVITIDPARYQHRLVAVPVSSLLADPRFRERLASHGVRAEAAPVRAGWYLQLPGGQTVSLAPAYRPVSRRLRPAPSTLLRPEHGLVPFLGRQPVLDRITGWCQGPASSPLLLVTGGGGSGKTRLGREACVQMLVAGWDAGLADDRRRDGTATTRLQRPTLLVVDDADLRTALISALIGYMRFDDAGPPVRLLLLARAAGAWWDRLVRQQELAGNYAVLDLDGYPVPPASRAEHFRCASTAFAAYRDPGTQPADPSPPPGLDDPAYGEPLLIHIAALLRTVQTSASPPPGLGEQCGPEKDSTAGQPGPPVRQALLKDLCERERTRWYRLGEHLLFNPDLPLVDQVVTLATLTAAGDQPCATSLLAALPNQAEVTRIGAEALVVWAHRLYSGPGYWNPLRPDLLAEQHLADTAQLAPLAIAAAQLAAGQPWEAALLTQLLAELTRGAPNQPAVQAALGELLAAALPRFVDLVVTAGHAGLADLASLALQLAPQPGLAASLADQMPDYSVPLAALAATVTSQQVTHYRACMIDGDTNTVILLAMALNNLSVRLSGLGRREEALAAGEEATNTWRELAAARPNTWRPALAESLKTLAGALADLGRREEALAAGEEATNTWRELAAARPDRFRADLASSLHNLSNDLADLGRREEALAAIGEAVTIRQELAAARPDVFGPYLAGSLNNLSNRLADLGWREEALAAIEKAIDIRREQARARPDAFGPDLAGSLHNLSVRLSGLGRREEALAAGEEATNTWRELARARPDAFGPDLAGSLHNLSFQLSGLGRREEALAAIEEAIDIRRELARARPDAFGPDLAGSLHNLSIQLSGLGRREEALAAIEEAVTIRRELAARWPAAYRHKLEQSLRVVARLEHDEDLGDASSREPKE
jgi:tetratricopeptide (TPR) repeat protein